MRSPPRDVLINRLSPQLIGQGEDGRGKTWTLRGAPVGATVRAVGRPKAGVRLELVAPAPDAVAPACAQFGACGGCQLQEMPRARQAAEKLRAVEALLAPLGGACEGVDTPGPAYGWRNKVELSFSNRRYLLPAEHHAARDAGEVPDRRGRWLGFHAPGRFDRVVDTPRCELVSERLNGVLAAVRAAVAASPWDCWDPYEHAGFFRHLLLRETRGGVLVALYTSPGDDAQAAWVEALLASLVPGLPGLQGEALGVAGASWFENAAPADASGGTLRLHRGAPAVDESLGGVSFHLSAETFFQANLGGAERIVEILRAWTGALAPGATVWDLYCGTGALGLALVRGTDAALVGIEAVEASVAAARATAAENGIPATFHAGPVEDLAAGLGRPSPLVVLVDPPRIGLHPRALGLLAELDADVLLYVSCRPSSLLRDGLGLAAAGWALVRWRAVDLFPHAPHLEIVSCWKRVRCAA